MQPKQYKYVVAGAGLAGASAVEGIRERDPQGSVLLIGSEPDLPYNRPPLSKKLWSGKAKVEDIFVRGADFYREHGVDLALGVKVVRVDAERQSVADSHGNTYGYEKLLLATGGQPRKLTIPGGDLPGVCYFRTLADYRGVREQAAAGKSATIIGGGFIGSELAAALNTNHLQVTMVFPSPYVVNRVFPEALGRAVEADYRKRGVEILSGDVPVSIEHSKGKFIIRTRAGRQLESDLAIAGIGIVPDVELAQGAGLQTGNGIHVNEQLQTSNPDVFAAGDNAFFPEAVLGPTRVEHWDNAMAQGKCAGANMAGARQPYTHLPFFFSDLFDFGYEAVGEVSTKLQTFADWKDENRTGVIYYLQEGRVRGAMMCNVWDKVDAARDLIRSGREMKPEDLRGAIG